MLHSYIRWQTHLHQQNCCWISVCCSWRWIHVKLWPLGQQLLSACKYLWHGHFLQCREKEEEGAGRGENGYLYLLAPQLRPQIPGGFLTQCSTKWCCWRSDEVTHSVGEGDVPHLSAFWSRVCTTESCFNSNCVLFHWVFKQPYHSSWSSFISLSLPVQPGSGRDFFEEFCFVSIPISSHFQSPVHIIQI